MTIDSNKLRWASEDQIDPQTGLPNKSEPSDEFKSSGVKREQPLPRQWINNQFYEMYEAFKDIQEQLDTISGGSSLPTLEYIYPVDSLYMTFSATDPATYLGFGVWTKIGGSFLVSQEDGDPDFGTVGNTGGSKEHFHTDSFSVDGHALTVDEIPAHSHEISSIRSNSNSGSFIEDADGSGTSSSTNTQSSGGGLEHTHGISGGVQTSSNLPPFTTVYMYKRVS